MSGRKPRTFQEIRDDIANAIDESDPQQRRRYARAYEELYRMGIKVAEAGMSDVSKGVALKALQFWTELAGGKAVTPVAVSGTVEHKTAEEHLKSAIAKLDSLKDRVM